MFAVIKTGGKQYSVAADDQIRVESLAGEPGDMVEINEVLMVGNSVGTPFVDGAMVTAEIVEQGRARKVIAFKKRRRQNSRRTIGHRQHYTLLQISEILTDGKKPSKKSDGSAQKAAEAARAARAARNGGAAIAADAAPAAKAEAPAPKAEKKTDEKPAPKKEAPKAETKDDAAPAPLFTAPEGEPDDLKKISGVGPVLEKKLNAFGVTKFSQVAALTKEEIEKLDDALSFKGRIERDEWTKQAAELAKESD
ncbi:MAG: 50S ribosomal protein L21 [Pseudomonadota bacterium]